MTPFLSGETGKKKCNLCTEDEMCYKKSRESENWLGVTAVLCELGHMNFVPSHISIGRLWWDFTLASTRPLASQLTYLTLLQRLPKYVSSSLSLAGT